MSTTPSSVADIRSRRRALIESTNTKIRVLHRMAFGFAKSEHLIGLFSIRRGAVFSGDPPIGIHH